MKSAPWLWPDHVIGKRESRRLREEHNALANEQAELLKALGEIADDACWSDEDTVESLRVRLDNLSEYACAAIAKAKGVQHG